MEVDLDWNDDDMLNIEFSNVFRDYKIQKDRLKAFDIIFKFKSLSASKALGVFDTNNEKRFEMYNLETKLWDLVENLYWSRSKRNSDLYKENKLTSISVKVENFLRKEHEVKEHSIVIEWLCRNMKSFDLESVTIDVEKLRKIFSNSSEHFPTHKKEEEVEKNKQNMEEDLSEKNKFYKVIYKLVFANEIKKAIILCSKTCNFQMGLILTCALNDYFNPAIDLVEKQKDAFANSDETASGMKHRLMWKKTLHELSKKDLPKYEILIYKFLSGSNIEKNLEECLDSWEDSLLIYLNQLYAFEINKFLKEECFVDNINEDIPVVIPDPQHFLISEILNTLQSHSETLKIESNHPLRVIMGSIMTDKFHLLLKNIVDRDGKDEVLKIDGVLRILTNLSIFVSLITNDKSMDSDVSKIIKIYVDFLTKKKMFDCISIYLSFIPIEKDALDAFISFFSILEDSDERMRQKNIVKKMFFYRHCRNNDIDKEEISNNEKMEFIFRSSVQLILNKIDVISVPDDLTNFHCNTTDISEFDLKLCYSVECFFENNMHFDSITSSLILFRFFLSKGKIASLIKFASRKNFKSLINEYEIEFHTNSFLDSTTNINFSSKKMELIEYSNLCEVFVLLNKFQNLGINSNSDSEIFLNKFNHLEVKKILDFVEQWLKNLINSDVHENDKKLFQNFRYIYVPYIIISLLSFYNSISLQDYLYVNNILKLVNEVSNEKKNDFLKCFVTTGQLNHFLNKSISLFMYKLKKPNESFLFNRNS